MYLAWGREDLGEATPAGFKYLQGCQVEEEEAYSVRSRRQK